MSDTDTPRTDKLLKRLEDQHFNVFDAQPYLAELARTLERELNTVAFWQDAKKKELSLVNKLYDELLMAVGTKWPGETRHQTALRYILQSEAQNPSKAKAPHDAV